MHGSVRLGVGEMKTGTNQQSETRFRTNAMTLEWRRVQYGCAQCHNETRTMMHWNRDRANVCACFGGGVLSKRARVIEDVDKTKKQNKTNNYVKLTKTKNPEISGGNKPKKDDKDEEKEEEDEEERTSNPPIHTTHTIKFIVMVTDECGINQCDLVLVLSRMAKVERMDLIEPDFDDAHVALVPCDPWPPVTERKIR